VHDGTSWGFLALGVLGAFVVANAWRPLRWPVAQGLSFLAGWIASELPMHLAAMAGLATLGFGLAGAVAAWPGIVGGLLAGCCIVGYAGLWVAGRRAWGAVVRGERLASAALDVPASAPASGRDTHVVGWRLVRAIPKPLREIEVVRDLQYVDDGRRAHRLDVLRPRVAEPAGSKWPVFVYVHGGGWVLGNKRQQGRPLLIELARRGWLGVTIEYSLSPRATWPDHIVDVKSAIAWLRANAASLGGDPSFLAVGGGSAGGHLAALAALTPGDPAFEPGLDGHDTSVDACVALYGVYDFTCGLGPEGTDRRRVGDRALLRLLERHVLKARVDVERARFVAASPLYRVHAGAPPFLVLHGANDTLVAPREGRRFAHALRDASREPVEYVELPFAQHAFDIFWSPRCAHAVAGIVRFLEAMRARKAAGSTPASQASKASLSSGPNA
jgi:acetyl esterase/lipase